MIFTKYDKIGSEQLVIQLAADLGVPDPIAISSTSGYGMHKLKTMIGSKMPHHSK